MAVVLKDAARVAAEAPQIAWLAEGHGSPRNKIDTLDSLREILAQPHAPKRVAENQERTDRIRSRFHQAAADAQELRGMLVGKEDESAWWRTQRDIPKGGRPVTKDDPLTVLVACGGQAGVDAARDWRSTGRAGHESASWGPFASKVATPAKVLLRSAPSDRSCCSLHSFPGSVAQSRAVSRAG